MIARLLSTGGAAGQKLRNCATHARLRRGSWRFLECFATPATLRGSLLCRMCCTRVSGGSWCASPEFGLGSKFAGRVGRAPVEIVSDAGIRIASETRRGAWSRGMRQGGFDARLLTTALPSFVQRCDPRGRQGGSGPSELAPPCRDVRIAPILVRLRKALSVYR